MQKFSKLLLPHQQQQQQQQQQPIKSEGNSLEEIGSRMMDPNSQDDVTFNSPFLMSALEGRSPIAIVS
jgi:hypothetical protein